MEQNGTNETTTVKMCPFYLNIYKRMRRWFGYTYPYWLTNMDEAELLKCILQLNMKPNMYLIFVNVACRIRLNNNATTTRLEEYKKNNVSNDKIIKRKLYYDENKERIRIYNHHYNQIKTAFSGINIFKKNT